MKEYKKEYDVLVEYNMKPTIQSDQDIINSKILDFCNPDNYENSISNFEEYEPSDEEIKNLKACRLLKYITHKDTRFDDNSVRIQGLLKLPKEVISIPNLDLLYIKELDSFYIQDLTINYIKNL